MTSQTASGFKELEVSPPALSSAGLKVCSGQCSREGTMGTVKPLYIV